MTFNHDDIHSLALCAWKEARGEKQQPQACDAVMHVIINRVGGSGFGRTLHDCIYGRNQFTSMSVPGDPEFNLQPREDDPTFLLCLESAAQLLANADSPDRVDITNGAHYYANLVNTTSGWFFRNIVEKPSEHPVVATIGHHTFFA